MASSGNSTGGGGGVVVDPALPPLIRIKPRKSSGPEVGETGRRLSDTQDMDEDPSTQPLHIHDDEDGMEMEETLADEAKQGLEEGSESGSWNVEEAATEKEMEEAVHQVVQVFSKPQPDRDRLYKAVYRAVIGELTIKESSTVYGFATSTMHPYVHRARAILGDRAPPMKSNRVGLQRPGGGAPKSHFKFPPHLQVLKPKPPGKSRPLKPPSGVDLLDSELISSSPLGARSFGEEESGEGESPIECLPVEKVSEEEEEEDESGMDTSQVPSLTGTELSSKDALHIAEDPEEEEEREGRKSGSPRENGAADPLLDESNSQETLSPEDAAREAMESIELESDQERMQLFFLLVRCLNGEMDAGEAAGSASLPENLVNTAVQYGKTLLGVPPERTSSGTKELNERQVVNSVEEAVRRATRCSHYQGSDRERLYLAVLQTVLGELPLTQAAATHSVPFSTLHPYVKRAKVLLGLSPGSTLATSTSNPLSMVTAEPPSFLTTSSQSLSSLTGKGSEGSVNGSGNGAGFRTPTSSASPNKSSENSKPFSRPRPSGSGGRQRDELPQFWKDNPALMKEGVKRAVQSCQYDDPSKKDRLCSAVIEALLGRKTMKAAAAMHDVPFTTLQTYFHRSRAQLQREVEARNRSSADPLPLLPNDPPSPSTSEDLRATPSYSRNSPESDEVSLDWQSMEAVNSSSPSLSSSNPRKRRFGGGGLEDLWSKLKARQANAENIDSASSSPFLQHNSPLLNGDNPFSDKFKDEPVDMSISSKKTSVASTVPSVKPDPVPAPVPSEPAVGASKRKPKKIIHHSVQPQPTTAQPKEEDNTLSNSSSKPSIPFPGVAGSNINVENGDEMQVPCANNRSVSDYLRDLMSQPNLNGEASKIHIVVPQAPEEEEEGEAPLIEASPEELDSDSPFKLNLEELRGGGKGKMKAEEAVVRAIRNSQYDGTDRERLREAVLTAVKGDRSMKEASRLFAIPLGTFHTYYHRARNLLEAAEAGMDPDSPAVIALLNTLSGGSAALAKKKKPPKTKASSVIVSYPIPSSPGDVGEGGRESSPALPPPPPKSPPLEIVGRKATDEEVSKVVSKVIKNSQYPPEQKLRLQQAVSRVIRGDMTINAAANVYQLPSSTVHPYVHRTRAVLGEACPPQAKLTKVGNMSRVDKFADFLSPAEKQSISKPSPSSSASLSGLDLQKEISRKTKLMEERKKLADRPTINPADLSLEDADKVVTELVKSSLYNEEGRQRLYEAILMVVTESATCSEASRAYNIPPSTIQPYVQRARVALNLPLNPSSGGGANSLSAQKSAAARKAVLAPKVYAAPGKEATYEEVEEIVKGVVQNSVQADNRRERLYKAVLAAVSGRKTIKDGCTEQDLPASTVHPYVSRARHMLGSRCPPPKIATIGPSAMGNVRNFYKNKGFPGMPPPESSSPDPDSEVPSPSDEAMEEVPEESEHSEDGEEEMDGDLIIPSEWISGNAEERQAQLDVLEDRLSQILGRYNYRGDRDKLVKAITLVIGEAKSAQEVSQTTGIAHTTLATYVRIARQFVKSSPAAPKPSRESEGEGSRSSLNGEIGEEIATDSTPSNRPKGIAIARVRSTTNGSTILDAPDETERMKSILRHLILSLYRRGATQQSFLTDAVNEVLFDGKTSSSVIESRPGISEHVVSVYVDRVRKANSILEEQLPIVYGIAEGSLSEQQLMPSAGGEEKEVESSPAKRARKSLGSPSLSPPPPTPSSASSPPLTPTRTSRRLQEKAKDIPSQSYSGGDLILSDKMDASLGTFLKRLHGTGFPVSTEFLIALVTNILNKDKTSNPREELNPSWAEKFRQRHNISGHRISQ